jgi:hypothetical protein
MPPLQQGIVLPESCSSVDLQFPQYFVSQFLGSAVASGEMDVCSFNR